MVEILPTILTDNPESARKRLEVIRGHATWVQVDVVDGVFAKARTLEANAFPEILEDFHVEVQLMVQDPAMYIQDWYQAGARRVIVHVESSGDIQEYLRTVRRLGMEAGIGIAPATPLNRITKLLGIADRVLVLGVDPGFGGQSFRPETIERIKKIRSLNSRIPIELDGGVTPRVAEQALHAGATSFAVNTYLFSSKNPLSALEEFRALLGL